MNGQNAETVLKSVREKFARVKDYKADANIKTEVHFINILPVNAFIYYKQPDKIHLQAKGIAILPKQGPDFLFSALLNPDNFVPVDMGTQLISGMNLRVIKLLPLNDTVDLVLGTVWIDVQSLLIYKTRVTSKSHGTVDIDFAYGNYASYLLPDKVVFEMDINKFKIPKAIAADLEDSQHRTKSNNKDKRGKVTISYKSYIINKGVDDKVFK